MNASRFLAALALLSASPLSAFGFSSNEHESIWILASEKLSPAAKTATNIILKGDTTEKAAVWADWVRLRETKPTKEYPVPKITDEEIQDVIAYPAFSGSNDWHFVDLPLDSVGYAEGLPSVNDNDIVHGLKTCISILEQPDMSADEIVHHRALRFLIHLVGDIHQPLHVACGYYTKNGSAVDLVTSPEIVLKQHLLDDKGGNQLEVDGSKLNLHHMWDDTIPENMNGRPLLSTTSKMVAYLRTARSAQRVAPAEDEKKDVKDWPLDWVKDDLKIARAAYGPVKIGAISQALDKNHRPTTYIEPTPLLKFDEDGYIQDHVKDVQSQMLMASERLADILNAIVWPSQDR